MKRDPNIDPAHVPAIQKLVSIMAASLGGQNRALAALKVRSSTLHRARTENRLTASMARRIVVGFKRWRESKQ